MAVNQTKKQAGRCDNVVTKAIFRSHLTTLETERDIVGITPSRIGWLLDYVVVARTRSIPSQSFRHLSTLPCLVVFRTSHGIFVT